MYDLLVLGGGPAGYLAAERAAQGGLKTAVIEKQELGGVCLNEGCIPSKALLYCAKVYDQARHGEPFGVFAEGIRLEHGAVQKRREKVVRALVSGVKGKLRHAGVDVIAGEGVITGKNAGGFVVEVAGTRHEAKRLLIATGSSPVVPPIPGLREGIESGHVITNRAALELDTVPKKLVVIGGGVIGLEMASYYHTAGAEVTVVEMLDHIGGPTDGDIAKTLLAEYEKKGVVFHLQTKAAEVTPNGVRCQGPSGEVLLEADKVLCAIGRRANTKGIGLEAIGIEVGLQGIITDKQMRTNVPGVFAAGDVNGKSMLAHTAYRESEVAVSTMLGKSDVMRYHAIPAVIYTYPEVASVGYTEKEAAERGFAFEARSLSKKYSGRFVAENEGDGFCKILIDSRRRTILGVHMIGSYASEIIWGASALMEMEMRVRDIKQLVFPHPTVSEIIREVIWSFED